MGLLDVYFYIKSHGKIPHKLADRLAFKRDLESAIKRKVLIPVEAVRTNRGLLTFKRLSYEEWKNIRQKSKRIYYIIGKEFDVEAAAAIKIKILYDLLEKATRLDKKYPRKRKLLTKRKKRRIKKMLMDLIKRFLED